MPRTAIRACRRTITGQRGCPHIAADPASLEPGLSGGAATLGDGRTPVTMACIGCMPGTGRVATIAVWSRRPPASHWLCDPDLPAHAVTEVPASIAGRPGRMARGRPSAGRRWPRLDVRRGHLGACGNSAERRWNETILGSRITPSRISIARRMVWSRSQAPGPSITVRRCGISAWLISQVAEFHR
jgi:hypothetical protein